MTLLSIFSELGEGLWAIPALTFAAGIFFFVKGYYEQKQFKSLNASGKVAPFWWYAPTIAGILLLLATVGILIWINAEK